MSLPPLALNAWLRYDVVRRLLDQLPDVTSVLEIGCGLGGVAARLAQRYDYVGVEQDATSAGVAAERLAALGRGRIVHGTVADLDAGRRFDLVCAFEVIEHIDDDVAALREWREHVRPGGWVLLSTPAHPHRYAALDRVAGHYRRYETHDMARRLRDAGFTDVDGRLYGFPLGYPLEMARNFLAARHESSDDFETATSGSARLFQPPQALGTLTAVASAPFRLAQRPFPRRGVGMVVLARRPD